MLQARVRHRDVELAGQRSVRNDEPGEPRAVLYGPRHPNKRNPAGCLVACADRLVCAGTVCFIGAAATGRLIGAAATACATAAKATEARAEGRRTSTSRSSATVAR